MLVDYLRAASPHKEDREGVELPDLTLKPDSVDKKHRHVSFDLLVQRHVLISNVPAQEFVELFEGGVGRIPPILGVIVNVLLKPPLHVRDLGLHRRLEAIEHGNQGISDLDDLTVLINDNRVGKGINFRVEGIETVDQENRVLVEHSDVRAGLLFDGIDPLAEFDNRLHEFEVRHAFFPLGRLATHRPWGL